MIPRELLANLVTLGFVGNPRRLVLPGSIQVVWLCPGLVCEGLELAPRDTLSGRETKHSLLVVLGEKGETFIIVGAFIAPHPLQ